MGGVLIGVGNAWRHDDGAGLVTARRARAHVGADVVIVELDGEPSRVIDAWDGADTAVVVDAVAGGDAPGTILRIDPDAPFDAARRGSSHALGVGEALELGRVLGRMPARLVVYGIVGQDFGSGEGLTPAVETACERLARELTEHFPREVGGGR